MMEYRESAVETMNDGPAKTEDQVRLKNWSVLLLGLTFQYRCEREVVRHDANLPATNLSTVKKR